MSVDPVEELLRRADAGAPRRMPAPPSVAYLRRRARAEVMVRAAAALALVGAAWTWSALRSVEPEQAPTIAQAPLSLEDALAAFDARLAALEPGEDDLDRARRAAKEAVERGAVEGFRALHSGAEAGRPLALARMETLARRFPTTHGGRCARAYLDAAATVGTDEPAPSETPR